MPRYIYQTTGGCTLCGMCIYECPVGAIQIIAKRAQIDPKTCTNCGKCYENCASEGIKKIEKEDSINDSNESARR